jgi:hypothetical protein
VQAVGGSSGQVTIKSQAAGYILKTPGPSVHLPGNVPQHTAPPPIHPSSRGSQVGYTQAHATYPAARLERIQQAYSTNNGEVVVVEVRMVIMRPGRVQVQLIHVRFLLSE